MLKLRCPECLASISGTFDHGLVREYDDALLEGRDRMVEAYEEVLRKNLAELAELFAQALDLDLIGADDFA